MKTYMMEINACDLEEILESRENRIDCKIECISTSNLRLYEEDQFFYDIEGIIKEAKEYFKIRKIYLENDEKEKGC